MGISDAIFFKFFFFFLGGGGGGDFFLLICTKLLIVRAICGSAEQPLLGSNGRALSHPKPHPSDRIV